MTTTEPLTEREQQAAGYSVQMERIESHERRPNCLVLPAVRYYAV
jgi:hypothetical protein